MTPIDQWALSMRLDAMHPGGRIGPTAIQVAVGKSFTCSEALLGN